MRQSKYKQAIVIAENNAADFQEKLNEALAPIVDPQITIDSNRPFTAYILYSVSKDVPESVLELFELLDGEHHICLECPYFRTPTDKRMKKGECALKMERMRFEARACEHFYLWKKQQIENAEEIFHQIPYLLE